MKRVLIVTIAAVAACHQPQADKATAAAASPPPQPTAFKVGSTIPEVRIAAATKLPTNPDGGRIDEYCSDLSPPFKITPKSSGGRIAASRGWIVTSETKLGKYDAVTFVGALDAATSATCVHRDGNLAIFDGSRLVAIAYDPPGRDADDVGDSLGSAEQIDPRRIRLHWGLPGWPIADVVLREGIYVEHTAKEDRVCGGAALVPNVFGEEIKQARKKLRSYGWLPQKPKEEAPGSEYLNPTGVSEVESCSGTGYGFCAYNYRNKKGFGLRVISVGEEYRVEGYEPYCSGSWKDRLPGPGFY